MFNTNGYLSKTFIANINWFDMDYVVNDDAFNVLNQIIKDNNIQKTNSYIDNNKLLNLLFDINVYNNDVNVQLSAFDQYDYNNTEVQYHFTVITNSNLTFSLVT